MRFQKYLACEKKLLKYLIVVVLAFFYSSAFSSESACDDIKGQTVSATYQLRIEDEQIYLFTFCEVPAIKRYFVVLDIYPSMLPSYKVIAADEVVSEEKK